MPRSNSLTRDCPTSSRAATSTCVKFASRRRSRRSSASTRCSGWWIVFFMAAHIRKAASKAISNFQIAVNRIFLAPIPWRCAMSMGRNKDFECIADMFDERPGTGFPTWSGPLQCGASHDQRGLGIDSVAAVIAATDVLSKAAFRTHLRKASGPITRTSPNPQLQFTASFAPAATPCELHPTSAHPPHSTSHHRECCPPVRLTLRIPERMVHA